MSNAARFSIIIPSLDPDERLLNAVEDCIRNGFSKILVVNDGSQQKCQDIFSRTSEKDECVLL